MPIYEYDCPNCGHRFEKLVRNLSGDQEIHCPRCREDGSTRVLSSFAVSRQSFAAALASAPARIGGG
jgi:putative FmdB family regulatory protein